MACGNNCGMGINQQRYDAPILSRYAPIGMPGLSFPGDMYRPNNSPNSLFSAQAKFNPEDFYRSQPAAIPYSSIDNGHAVAQMKEISGRDNRPASSKYGGTAYWNVSGV